jgi:hypothetical protein
MDETKMPTKVLKVKFQRRPLGRPQLRWQDIRSNFSLLLNIRGCRSLAGDRDIWRKLLQRPDCSVTKEE